MKAPSPVRSAGLSAVVDHTISKEGIGATHSRDLCITL